MEGRQRGFRCVGRHRPGTWIRRGTSPAGDGEGVLSLSTRFCEASEEAGKEGVRLGSEGIDSQGPAALGGELTGVGPDEVAADRPGHLGGTCARVTIDALSDGDTAGCVEVQGVEAHAALEAE